MENSFFKKVIFIKDNQIIIDDQNKFDIFGNVLDLGSGEMKYYDNLNGIFKGIDSAETKNKNVIKGNLKRKSTWKQFDTNLFDCITSFGLLHWLNNLNMCFLEMKRILKPSGNMFHIFWHEDNYETDKVNTLTNYEKIYTSNMYKTNEFDFQNFIEKYDFKNYKIITKEYDIFKFIILITYG